MLKNAHTVSVGERLGSNIPTAWCRDKGTPLYSDWVFVGCNLMLIIKQCMFHSGGILEWWELSVMFPQATKPEVWLSDSSMHGLSQCSVHAHVCNSRLSTFNSGTSQCIHKGYSSCKETKCSVIHLPCEKLIVGQKHSEEQDIHCSFEIFSIFAWYLVPWKRKCGNSQAEYLLPNWICRESNVRVISLGKWARTGWKEWNRVWL